MLLSLSRLGARRTPLLASATLGSPKSCRSPNLIELQLDSFRWFVDQGLRELFDEISPIQDFTGKVMELHFLDYQFGEPKYFRARMSPAG